MQNLPLADDWLTWDPEFIDQYPHMPEPLAIGPELVPNGSAVEGSFCIVRKNSTMPQRIMSS
jgi:hypothetical protein